MLRVPSCRPASQLTHTLLFWIPPPSLEQIYLAASCPLREIPKKVRGRDLLLCFWLPRAPTSSAPFPEEGSVHQSFPLVLPRLDSSWSVNLRPQTLGSLWPWADSVAHLLGSSREVSSPRGSIIIKVKSIRMSFCPGSVNLFKHRSAPDFC